MKSRGCAKPIKELDEPKFKISKSGLVQFGPTQWRMCQTPYYSSSPPGFGVLSFDASVHFILVETVALYNTSAPKLLRKLLWFRSQG